MIKTKAHSRLGAESNCHFRICNPAHYHYVTQPVPFFQEKMEKIEKIEKKSVFLTTTNDSEETRGLLELRGVTHLVFVEHSLFFEKHLKSHQPNKLQKNSMNFFFSF